MAAVRLALSDDDADILGFALGVALRDQRAKSAAARAASPGGASAVVDGCFERIRRIERVRDLLDCAPEVSASGVAS